MSRGASGGCAGSGPLAEWTDQIVRELDDWCDVPLAHGATEPLTATLFHGSLLDCTARADIRVGSVWGRVRGGALCCPGHSRVCRGQ